MVKHIAYNHACTVYDLYIVWLISTLCTSIKLPALYLEKTKKIRLDEDN